MNRSIFRLQSKRLLFLWCFLSTSSARVPGCVAGFLEEASRVLFCEWSTSPGTEKKRFTLRPQSSANRKRTYRDLSVHDRHHLMTLILLESSASRFLCAGGPSTGVGSSPFTLDFTSVYLVLVYAKSASLHKAIKQNEIHNEQTDARPSPFLREALYAADSFALLVAGGDLESSWAIEPLSGLQSESETMLRAEEDIFACEVGCQKALNRAILATKVNLEVQFQSIEIKFHRWIGKGGYEGSGMTRLICRFLLAASLCKAINETNSDIHS